MTNHNIVRLGHMQSLGLWQALVVVVVCVHAHVATSTTAAGGT
jgi:hypothetical protein